MPDFGLEMVARQEWLDTIGERIQHRVNEAYNRNEATKRAKSFMKGDWLGHPLHTAVSDVPMGAWTVAAALDACEITTGFRGLALGADAAIHVGLAGALASMMTGWADWSETSGRARRIGLAHGLMHGGSVALYIASAVLRGSDQRQAARGLSLLAYVMAAAGSWLGGKLVYEEKVGLRPDEA
jgi:uncharacterized membrane protein